MNGKVLYVRGLSEAARQVLEREAELHHRSLSAQIVTILEEHVKQKPKEVIDWYGYARPSELDPNVSQS